jgi:DNA-binding HxlR family transcriptional regulator
VVTRRQLQQYISIPSIWGATLFLHARSLRSKTEPCKNLPLAAQLWMRSAHRGSCLTASRTNGPRSSFRCWLKIRKRYAELQREIGGISQKMLTQTLRSLERDGLVQRKVHPVVPPKVEYSLTKLGRTLIEPLHALCRWSEKHLAELQANRARAKANAME